MRSLCLCVLLVLCGAGYLLFTGSTSVVGADLPGPSTLNGSPADRSSPDDLVRLPAGLERTSLGLAQVHGAVQVKSEVAEPSVARAQTGPMTTLVVTVLRKDGAAGDAATAPILPGDSAGLRIRVRGLTSGASFGATMKPGESRAEISVPATGRYRVWIDPRSVDGGLLASGAQHLGALDTSGIGGAYVRPRGAERQNVDLFLFEAQALDGWVTGPAGTVLGGVTVRAQALAPGLAGLVHDVQTAQDGSFEFHHLFPVVYGIQVVDLGVQAECLLRQPMPPRQLFDLQYGPFSGVQLKLGAGRITVRGRVVDEQGAAFRHVSVRASYLGDAAHNLDLDFERAYTWNDHALSTTTDEEGRFTLQGLGEVPVRVQVGANEAMNGDARRARYLPAPHDIPLGRSSPDVVRMGDLVLPRSRRFQVRGRLVLPPAPKEGRGLDYRDLEILGKLHAVHPTDLPRPGREKRPFVTYDRKTGSFTISCESHQPECVITVGLRGRPASAKEYTFLPQENVILDEQVLSFP